MLFEDDNKVKVANLSKYIVHEFYTFHENPDETKEIKWFDAMPCTEEFEEIFGSFGNIPPSLKDELTGIH